MSVGGDALAIVLHGATADTGRADDQDTLIQVEAVGGALRAMGFVTEALPLTLNLGAEAARLKAAALVFNLVESLDGHDALLPMAPMLLERLGVPYTGCSARALVATTDKLLAKRLMRHASIPTPDWVDSSAPAATAGVRYIVKSVTEHASRGLDATSVVDGGDVAAALDRCRDRFGGEWFAEAFVEGREFNLSLIAGPDGADGPEVLPVAEIEFGGYPPGEPHILGYAAKWDPDSPLYDGSTRRQAFGSEDAGLLDRLAAVARECWRLFGLSGYARVDFRVDSAGDPHVLEVNGNPCLSPDAGFAAAAERAGLGLVEIVARIVAAVPGNHFRA